MTSTGQFRFPHVLIINAHQPYPYSKGTLNESYAERARQFFKEQGAVVRLIKTADEFDVAEQLRHHVSADLVVLQSPVNWMGIPWSAKKYMDEVYSAGMDGTLCQGDGRSRSDASKHYGSGGTLNDTKYMLSLTFNAPEEAFDDESQYLFAGKSIDDLFFPAHMNFKFFGMSPLPTFASMDVLKNPQIKDDFTRFDEHLRRVALSSASENNV